MKKYVVFFVFFSNVYSAFLECFSQFFNTNATFLVKSTLNPFFPLTMISF